MPSVNIETVADEALAWLHQYVAQPHPQIGREGSVCPFVEPSLAGGSLRLESWPVSRGAAAEELRAVVDRMVEVFEPGDWGAPNPTLRTLVVVLDGLAPEQHPQLDQLQSEAKAELAARGLMLGQFHPDCDEPAARNPDFPVSRAPLPMLAIRHMAFHDVLFLHGDPHLFGCYRERFGSRYARGGVPDPLFTELFDAAATRWPLDEADDPPDAQADNQADAQADEES